MPKPAGPAPRRRSGPRWILFGICLAWAAAASAYAIVGRGEIARLREEAAVRQALADDKVRALTRRLVGVASHQMLEQDGLAERLADIVARQVELENRAAALSAMSDRTLTDRITTERTTTDRATTDRGAAAPAGPQEDPPQPDGPRRIPGRNGALDAGTAVAALPVREQFARIEGSLGRAEGDQDRFVARLASLARAAGAQVRAVFADLNLALAPPPAPAPPPVPPGPAGTFARSVAATEAALAEARRWRALAEWVPLRPPIAGEGHATSNFGLRKDPFTGGQRLHAGMDFRSPVGTPVRTAASGRVTSAGPSGGYGNLVEIDHGRHLVTRYAHLSMIQVSVAQVVEAGSVVGLVGSTGRSTGPHLHYETRLSGGAVDPARFLAAGHRLYDGGPAPDAPRPAATADEEAAD
ncbi:M23 family metallopeptidase [Methylobacterium sp. NEAU 140]|uniref:M23 family metallopeptidase n=1 Tax=Methylobacterium sp. NEAU 140 TaxID=3064945 RepID=UPI002736B098|nr:M23 family metallopeptidase [Methylobacterium sp. NEAU 140]MDP4024914.1 M23 family metallopeptidase [Methylobacterium sp. NEAU 140]